MELPTEFEDRELNLAEAWASLDGCEPGDYLRCLLAAADEVGRSGRCANEDFHGGLLRLLIRDQVRLIKAGALVAPSGAYDHAALTELVREEDLGGG